MTLINLIVILALVGVGLWLVNTLIPMPVWVKKLINALAAVFVCLWVLQVFGLIGPLGHLRLR